MEIRLFRKQTILGAVISKISSSIYNHLACGIRATTSVICDVILGASTGVAQSSASRQVHLGGKPLRLFHQAEHLVQRPLSSRHHERCCRKCRLPAESLPQCLSGRAADHLRDVFRVAANPGHCPPFAGPLLPCVSLCLA